MKSPHECTEKELLIRIDERTQCLPDLKRKIEKHTISIVAISVALMFVLAKTFPAVLEAIK